MNDKYTMNKIFKYTALGKPIVRFDLTEGAFLGRGSLVVRAPSRAREIPRQPILTA